MEDSVLIYYVICEVWLRMDVTAHSETKSRQQDYSKNIYA